MGNTDEMLLTPQIVGCPAAGVTGYPPSFRLNDSERIFSESEEAVAEARREKLQPAAAVHRQDGRRQGQAEAALVGLG
jgi:hypothetical protein